MKNIFQIFKDDLRGLSKNILALVVAVGVCFLPSLYAWFNIFSNWDPYANTGNVPIAIVSEDRGYEKSDGTEVLMGEKVVDQLRDNTKLGWRFPKTSQEAIDGVYSGEYYAALVIPETFSEDMYDFLAKGMEHPQILYYENEKRNAIAVKITDSGSSSLQNSINTEFADVVITSLSEELNNLVDTEDGSIVDSLIVKLQDVNDNVLAYEDMLQSFMECNVQLSDTILDMKDLIPKIQQSINASIGSINNAKAQAKQDAAKAHAAADALNVATTAKVNTEIGVKLNLLTATITAANNSINEAQKQAASGSADVNTLASSLETTANSMTELSKTLNETAKLVPDPALKAQLQTAANQASAAGTAASTAAGATKKLGSITGVISGTNSAIVSASIDQIVAQLPAINQVIYGELTTLVNALSKQAAAAAAQAEADVNRAAAPSSGLDIDEDGLTALLDTVSQTLLATNVALDNSKSLLTETTDRLTSILDELTGLTEKEQYEKLMDILKNDPTLYGEFLSQPVQVSTVPVYETPKYGYAVSPFYTTLALWVGATILVSIIKVNVTPKNSYKNAKAYELFLGRYLMFFLMGQIQAFVCIWGDLHLLKIQCSEPGLLYLIGSVASFTFTLFIYSLTISFGDIGKAVAVIIMIVQIAGSSGTYAIETLPTIFQAIYTYFPFPYAINAMRETISGMYKNDYWIFLGELLLFAVAALIIGLVIRVPFMKVTHYIEHRMEDTEMM